MNSLLLQESPYLFLYWTLFVGIVDQVFIPKKYKYYSMTVYVIVVSMLFYAYRLPVRINNYPSNLMVAPCDGKVISILQINDSTTHVAIYLSLLDTHVQWCPIDGIVLSSKHKSGSFHPAYMFHKSRYNERIETIVYVPEIENEIKIVQIAGQIARRIVNYKQNENDIMERGELMGMIKFGSRVDLFVPHDDIELLLNVGDVITGNKTIIGRFID